MIEIAWPTFGWHFYYTDGCPPAYGKLPLDFYQLETTNVTKFEESKKIRLGEHPKISGPITTQDILTKYRMWVLGKNCDFNVKPQKLLEMVERALNRTDNKPWKNPPAFKHLCS